MCGIIGFFSNTNSFNPKVFAEANNLVRYRGPDDFGYVSFNYSFQVKEYKSENLQDFNISEIYFGILGFRRLSIIDLSASGHQPMTDETRKYWIIFNVEIYNYIELKEELIRIGYHFKSNTDTEIIINSYKAWGTDCLKRFNGMWSFCIVDLEKRKLFCSRDRLGIKPFYYFFSKDDFIFASEIKQLLKFSQVKYKVNQTVLFDYLVTGSYGNESEQTFFENIFKLNAGSYIYINIGDYKNIPSNIHSYWNLEDLKDFKAAENETYNTILFLLKDSIKLRLRSDVPVGTCLSGGLDSSGIVCLVNEILHERKSKIPHKVFVIGSHNPSHDETYYAKKIIEKTGVEAFLKIPDENDLQKDLDTFIWHHDEPLIKASMFGGYQVYRMAKEHGCTVVLDGQGADELLGGYNIGPHYNYLLQLLSSGLFKEFKNQFEQNCILYQLSAFKAILYIIKKSIFRAIHSLTGNCFHPQLYSFSKNWVTREFFKQNIKNSQSINQQFMEKNKLFTTNFKKETFMLIRHTNLPGILRQVDRNSMAFSVEARVPFLDYRLVEYLYSLPDNLILNNGFTKFAYREAMKKVLPEEVRLRTDKLGFSVAERDLLAGSLKYVKNIINNLNHKSSIFNTISIKKNYLRIIERPENYDSIIWRTINSIVWSNKFNLDIS